MFVTHTQGKVHWALTLGKKQYNGPYKHYTWMYTSQTTYFNNNTWFPLQDLDYVIEKIF